MIFKGFKGEWDETMRIAFNLHGFSAGHGGVATYVSSLFSALQQADQENEYIVLCDRSTANDFRPVISNFHLRVSAFERPSPRWILRGLLQRTCNYDLLARELTSLDADVIHHPLTVLNPRGLSIPSVLTFHDLQQEYFPEFFSSAELRRRAATYALSVREARSIIAISNHAKECLLARYELPSEKIHVIYHGVAKCFQRIQDPICCAEVVCRYLLEKPFIIYPAATWLHKNHLRLLAAVRVLIDRGLFDGELLLTGAPMDAHLQVLSEIYRLRLEKYVRWLGYVPSEDLPVLYSLARLMIFPSLFEGFGLPVIEAMACGCPVVCSDTTSLPEVAGDAACLVDPNSVEGIAEGLSALWGNDAELLNFSQKGLVRAAFFSWKKTALETIEVYRKVAG